MSWLLKIAGRDDYLAGLGASPDIIQYIMSQDDASYSHFLTNQFRMNPSMTLPDLQSLKMPVKEPPYLPLEEDNAEMLIRRWPEEKRHLAGAFRQWVLVQFRKYRRPQHDLYMGTTYNTSTCPDYPYERASMQAMIDQFFRPIKDWYIDTESQIASYSLEAASEATRQWEQAKRGDGEVYDGADKVVYSWNQGQFAGWSIKRIRSQNNAIVEGDLMSHCVGDCEYQDTYDKVEQEPAAIFRDRHMGTYVELYSLRDNKNQPHVTIELSANTNDKNTNADGNEEEFDQVIFQIYGPGNSEPKPQYKKLIGEWFKSRPNQLTWDQNQNVDVSVLKYETPRTLPDVAATLLDDGDEYGVRGRIDDVNIESLYDVFMHVCTGNDRNYDASSSDINCADFLIRWAWEADKRWMRDGCGMPETHYKKWSKIMWLEHKNDENYEKLWQYYEPNEPMPDEDDFETNEEYIQAYKEWEEQEEDAQDFAIKHYLPYAFDNHMMKVLYKELTPNDPSYAEIKKQCIRSDSDIS